MTDRKRTLLSNSTAEVDFKCPCCETMVHIGEVIHKNADGNDCHAECVKEDK